MTERDDIEPIPNVGDHVRLAWGGWQGTVVYQDALVLSIEEGTHNAVNVVVVEEGDDGDSYLEWRSDVPYVAPNDVAKATELCWTDGYERASDRQTS